MGLLIALAVVVLLVLVIRVGMAVSARRRASELREAGLDPVGPLESSRRPAGSHQVVATGFRDGLRVVVERWNPTVSTAGEHSGRPSVRVIVAEGVDPGGSGQSSSPASSPAADDVRAPGRPKVVVRRTRFVVDQATATGGMGSVATDDPGVEAWAVGDSADARALVARVLDAVGDLMAGDIRRGVDEVVWSPGAVVVVRAESAVSVGPIEQAIGVATALLRG